LLGIKITQASDLYMGRKDLIYTWMSHWMLILLNIWMHLNGGRVITTTKQVICEGKYFLLISRYLARD